MNFIVHIQKQKDYSKFLHKKIEKIKRTKERKSKHKNYTFRTTKSKDE